MGRGLSATCTTGVAHNAMFNVAVTNNPIVSADPNLRNAVHVFLPGASFRPSTGCLDYGGGGYIPVFHCGQPGTNLGMVGYGNFYSYNYNLTGQSPDGVAWTGAPPTPEDIPYGGNIILVEFLHTVSVDHPFGTSHLTGGDQCNDTPASQETPNNMMQTWYQQQLLHPSLRCALTECQLGRMHHYFEELNPIWVRTEENGFTQTIGVFVNHSGDEPNTIYKNGLRGVDYGNLSNGKNRGSSPNDGLQYQCKNNLGNGFDFAVPAENYGVVGIAEFQGSSAQAAGNTFSQVLPASQPEMHFFNQAAPVTYYIPPAPVNYSVNSISFQQGVSNICPSKLPSGKENGGLSELEVEGHEQTFANSNEATVKAEAANMLIRNYLIDEDGIQLAAAKTWLANKGSLDAHFAIVDAWLQEGNVAGTQQALANLPPLVHPPAELQAEYTHFNALKGIQINALQTGLSELQMVNANAPQLKTIAEAGDYYASVQAQVMLNDLAGAGYQPDVVLPSPGQQNLVAPPATGNILTAETTNLQAVPNPAVQETVFHYRLPEGVEQAQIIITATDGRVVERIAVGAERNQIRWSTKNCKSGLYIYHLVIDTKTISSGRLVIIK